MSPDNTLKKIQAARREWMAKFKYNLGDRTKARRRLSQQILSRVGWMAIQRAHGVDNETDVKEG